MRAPPTGAAALTRLQREVVGCHACPRLVRHRQAVARRPRRAFAGECYWGRPVPSFGADTAQLLLVGLAPAAHGANRTGRMFTGDRSGDFLFGALHRAGLASRSAAFSRTDGLRLRGCRITAVVRCAPPANRPLPAERDRCLPFLAREIRALRRLRLILCLGGFALDGTLRAFASLGARLPSPRPRFAHGAVHRVGEGLPPVLCAYHPSQQNTFTGRLTPPMMDRILTRAARLAGLAAVLPGGGGRP